MITLKESILKGTATHIKDIPDVIKKAQREQIGFPEFEDEGGDGWVWMCPEILERNKSNIYKITKRRKTYYGFWAEMIPTKIGPYDDGTYKDAYMVTIDAITDHTGNMPWMGSNELLSIICDKDKKTVYEFFLLFGLNVDAMIKDFVKLGDDYVYEDVYKMFMKKYGK